jgi:cbb3-type cytochrome oxidase subunit 3
MGNCSGTECDDGYYAVNSTGSGTGADNVHICAKCQCDPDHTHSNSKGEYQCSTSSSSPSGFHCDCVSGYGGYDCSKRSNQTTDPNILMGEVVFVCFIVAFILAVMYWSCRKHRRRRMRQANMANVIMSIYIYTYICLFVYVDFVYSAVYFNPSDLFILPSSSFSLFSSTCNR